MTRLIDADKLPNIYTATHQEMIMAFEEAPTVEAIPVEWLEDFRDGLDTLSENRLMHAIDLIIDAYRVEKKRKEE